MGAGLIATCTGASRICIHRPMAGHHPAIRHCRAVPRVPNPTGNCQNLDHNNYGVTRLLLHQHRWLGREVLEALEALEALDALNTLSGRALLCDQPPLSCLSSL